MKIKMKEVCELLDIPFGKNFNIKDYGNNPFYINDNGLHDCYGMIDSFSLRRLLIGELSIEKDILTDKEREYLSNIIKPDSIYKNVKGIMKNAVLGGYYIKICMKVTEASPGVGIFFPVFREYKNMYAEMECNRLYTLAELGLEKKTSYYDKLNPLEKIMINRLTNDHPINIDTVAEIYITYDRNYKRTKNILYSMHTRGL